LFFINNNNTIEHHFEEKNVQIMLSNVQWVA
jgi:hypothetical protein